MEVYPLMEEAFQNYILSGHVRVNPKPSCTVWNTNHQIVNSIQCLTTVGDPNILLESIPEDEEVLVLELKIETMSLEAAEMPWKTP